MESNFLLEKERIEKLLTNLKKLQIDNYLPGNYLDALDDSKQWCVAEVIERENEKIKIHFDGWSNKYDEVLTVKSRKINHFRRLSKGYTGQKTTAYRLYTFKYEDFLEIKNLIKILIETNFECLDDPLEITQILRGKIFIWIDIFLTCPFIMNKDKNESPVEEIIELLFDFIDLFILYLNYVKSHLYLLEVIMKYSDITLVDNKSAIVASLFEFIMTIKRIFAMDERTNIFFRSYENLIVNYLLEKNQKIEKNQNISNFSKICYNDSYVIKNKFNNVSVFIIANFIDYFNSKNGFNLIFEIIFGKFTSILNLNNNESFLPFFAILNFFKIFQYVFPFVDLSLNFSNHISQFKEFIFTRINNITEQEMKDNDKNIIEGIANLIKDVYNFDGEGIASAIISEELILSYYYKCFISKNLEKRIKGISHVDKLAEEINKQEISKNFIHSGNINQIENFTILDSNYLFTWMHEKNILEKILGETIHEEILKRSLNIFKFFVIKNSLNNEIYEMMWNALIDKHESIAKEIENILCELSYVMNEFDKNLIFEKIKLIPNFNTDLIKFVKNLSINCIKTDLTFKKENSLNLNRNFNLYGIPLLYNLVLDNNSYSNHSNELVEVGLECLIEIFKKCNLNEEILMKYLIQITENINNNNSVVQSLKLFKILISENNNNIDIIKMINEKYKIIEIVINDFERYFGKVLNKYNSNNITKISNNYKFNTPESKEFISKKYEGSYSHYENIVTRLDILNFLKSKNIPLSYQHIDKLWEILIINSITENEKNILFKFLLQSEDFNNNLIESIFLNIFINNDKFKSENVNFIGIKLYQKYFNIVNLNHNKIFIIHRKIKINTLNLLGGDHLWEILINTKNENVRREVSKFLVNLCLNPRKIEEELCIKIWTQFITKLILILQNNLNNENGIKGIILLIRNLIEEMNQEGEIPREDELIRYNNQIFPVIFVNPNLNNEKKTLNIGLNEIVFEVRDKISFYYKIPLQNLQFKINKKIIDQNDDEKIFREVFNQNYVVEIIVRNNPILEFKNINPKILIMDNKFIFETLFDLLHNSKSIYIDDAWELINMLPRSRQLEEEIFRLGSFNFENSENFGKYFYKFIDTESIYKMCYSLKIIRNFIDKSFEWVDYFNKNLGFKNLINVVNSLSESHFVDFNISKLSFQCLNDIFHIFVSANEYYLVNMEISLFDFEDIKELYNLLILKLFEFIFYIFKSSFINDSNKKFEDLQNDYTRKRNREFLHRQDLNNLNKNEIFDLGVIDEIHPLIRNLWNNEINNMITILNFLENFKIIKLLENLIYNENGIKILNEFVTFCLIFPQNSKLKLILFDYIIKWIKSDDINIETKTNFIFQIYRIIFNTETLKIIQNNKTNCEPFFNRVLSMINEYKLTNEITNINLNILTTLKEMIEYLRNENNIQEEVIIGYCSIISELILINEDIYTIVINENIIEILMNKYLFNQNKNIKLTSKMRLALLKLLARVCYNNNENMTLIIETMNQFYNSGFWRSKRLADWSIQQGEEKSSTNLTGLRNLGCTCYMNSLLQQFYMITSLREGILSAPDNPLFTQEESVLFQLKTIFGNLKLSDRKFYLPKDFCQNFKNYEGQPMNVLEQMDVDEFFNLLLDRIEIYIKNSNQENLFKNHFTGQMSNEVISKGCPHSSENFDIFSSIILQVKNKKSLEESLDAYVKGEILEGDNAYYCEKCDKKVNSVKRQSIKTLPNVLVIVLKRFEFDYNTSLKIKLNDYCEFPLELDMEPFTQKFLTENLNRNRNSPLNNLNENVFNDSKYSLSGVIIHTGTADSGHYYSIIKKEDSNDWFEFNDTSVTPYDISDLSDEAFGGEIKDNKGNNNNIITQNSTNAYVLFYRKNNQINNITNLDDNVEMQNYTNNLPQINNTNLSTFNIQPNIIEHILNDNYQFLISKILFSNEINEFVIDILINYNLYNNNLYKQFMITKNQNFTHNNIRENINNLNIPDRFFITNYFNIQNHINKVNLISNDLMFKFVCKVFFSTTMRSKDKTYITQFIDIIKANINSSIINADYILEEFSNYDLISEFIVECPNPDLKKLTVGIIYCAMIQSFNHFKISVDSSLHNFIMAILYLISKIKQFKGKDFTYLNLILWRFSQLGEETKQFLINKKIIQFIIEFYKSKNNQNESNINLENFIEIKLREPLHRDLNIKEMKLIKNEKMSMLEEYLEKKQLDKNITNVTTDVHLLMTLCEIFKSELANENRNIFIDYETIKLIINECKTRQSSIHLGNLFKLICYDNLDRTEIIMQVILDMINFVDSSESDYLMKLFKNVVLIEDKFINLRVSILFFINFIRFKLILTNISKF